MANNSNLDNQINNVLQQTELGIFQVNGTTKVLNLLLNYALQFSSGDFGILLLFDNSTQISYAVTSVSTDFPRVEILEAVRSKVLGILEPYISDISVPIEFGEQTNSELVIPFISQNGLQAAICIQSYKVNAFYQQQIGIFKEFSAQAVNIIDKLKLFEQKREQYEEAIQELKFIDEIIDDIDIDLNRVIEHILQIAVKAVAGNAANIMLVQENRLQIVASLGEHLLPLRVYDLEGKFENRNNLIHRIARGSELVVPIILEDRVFGVFNFESPQVDAFSEIDVMIIEKFARITAVVFSKLKNKETLTKILELGVEDNNCEAVYFRADYLSEVSHSTKCSMAIYAYIANFIEAVENDSLKFLSEIGNSSLTSKLSKQSSCLQLDTPLTIIPECDEIEFSPPIITQKWNGEWVKFNFNFKVSETYEVERLLIRVSIKIGHIEIAHINCPIDVGNPAKKLPKKLSKENPLAIAKMKSQTSKTYQKIFVSYSHKDVNVAENYRKAQIAAGNIVFMDSHSILAGEDWQASLANAIDDADIFQLFWSESAAKSKNVHAEWDYALRYKCADDLCIGFIRPVYWKQPIHKPPTELAHLNFRFVDFV